MSPEPRRPMVISPLWMQGMLLTFFFGFAVIVSLALRAAQHAAPSPGRVAADQGQVIATRADVVSAQEALLTYDRMEHGPGHGHAAHLGADFAGDAPRVQALKMHERVGGPAAEER